MPCPIFFINSAEESVVVTCVTLVPEELDDSFEVGDTEEETYEIVGAAEADAFNGKISNESPIATAMIGKKVGDTVKVTTPGGEMDVKIVNVQ